MYGLLGSFFGTGGSLLVDIRNPTHPTQVHRVPSSANTRNADVKFDPRDGLYYRSQEPNDGDGEGGVEIVDYGFGDATPETPEIVADLDTGPTHNVFPHPEEPILYATKDGRANFPDEIRNLERSAMEDRRGVRSEEGREVRRRPPLGVRRVDSRL